MQELRERVLELLEKTGLTQKEVIRRINDQGLYKIQPAELCKALKGELTSPKANRAIADAYSILQRERLKMLRDEFRKS